MKLYLFIFFIFSSMIVSAQTLETTRDGKQKLELTEDGKLQIRGISVFHDDSGRIIDSKAYSVMFNSQLYQIKFGFGGGDTIHHLLRSKAPSRYLGKKIPSQAFQGIDGKAFIAGRENHTTVLIFWGDRCVPCIELIDALDSLAINYKNVDFIAPATYGDVRQFHARHPWRHVRVPLEYNGLYDSFFPESPVVIIDGHGILRKMYWQNDLKAVVSFLDSLPSFSTTDSNGGGCQVKYTEAWRLH